MRPSAGMEPRFLREPIGFIYVWTTRLACIRVRPCRPSPRTECRSRRGGLRSHLEEVQRRCRRPYTGPEPALVSSTVSAAGVSERAIMNQTGHKSVAIARRYIREGSLFRENAAATLGLSIVGTLHVGKLWWRTSNSTLRPVGTRTSGAARQAQNFASPVQFANVELVHVDYRWPRLLDPSGVRRSGYRAIIREALRSQRTGRSPAPGASTVQRSCCLIVGTLAAARSTYR